MSEYFDDILGDDFFEDEDEEEILQPEAPVNGSGGPGVKGQEGILAPITSPATGKETTVLGATSTLGMTPQDAGKMLFHEVHKINKLYGTLEAIETILVGSADRLINLRREELMDMYKMFSARQRNGQNFITRMLELGVKTKILGQLMDTEAFQEEGKRPESRTAIVSDKAKKVSNLIRNEMDRRLGI